VRSQLRAISGGKPSPRSCVFHAGEIWHDPGPNTTGDRMRRSIGIHTAPADAQFGNLPAGYIYRRY
jgi:phytanoyl-CoA hydroxylase